MTYLPSLSIVIPTYGRDEVLTDMIGRLLALDAPADEILVVDQTPEHPPGIAEILSGWHDAGGICWIRHQTPGTVGAMNRGLLEAAGEIVLFLDDDIIPGEELVEAHRKAHERFPDAWAVVGQVLQPEDWGPQIAQMDADGVRDEGGREKQEGREEREEALPTNSTNGREGQEEEETEQQEEREGRGGVWPTNCTNGREDDRRESEGGEKLREDWCDSWVNSLTGDLEFCFAGNRGTWVSNVMAGNLSVKREKALAIGGFDANFTVPVAYRFETEFAKRVLARGGRIRFEPKASIKHLRAERGGTRSQGSHMMSVSPVHGVGDYYYALRCGRGWERLWYMAKRPFREVRTKFHLRHPWYIPVKFIGELRALLLALKLYRQGPKLLSQEGREAREEGGRE